MLYMFSIPANNRKLHTSTESSEETVFLCVWGLYFFGESDDSLPLEILSLFLRVFLGISGDVGFSNLALG